MHRLYHNTQCLHCNYVQLYLLYVHICTGHQRYVVCHSSVTRILHVCGTLWSSLCDCYNTGMLCTFHTSLLSCWPCLGCQRNSLRHVCPCSACDVQNRRHSCGLFQFQPVVSAIQTGCGVGDSTMGSPSCLRSFLVVIPDKLMGEVKSEGQKVLLGLAVNLVWHPVTPDNVSIVDARLHQLGFYSPVPLLVLPHVLVEPVHPIHEFGIGLVDIGAPWPSHPSVGAEWWP